MAKTVTKRGPSGSGGNGSTLLTTSHPTSRQQILANMKKEKVKFLRLEFTDILGISKNVEVPESQFEKALDGQILFDGSSIEGFARIEVGA